MFKFVIFVVLPMVVFSTVTLTEEEHEMFKKGIAILCVPNPPADKVKIAEDCGKIFPKTATEIYASCVKQIIGTEMTLPRICYRAPPHGEEVKNCLLGREAEAAAHGVVIDPKVKEAFKKRYVDCMSKIVA